MLREENGMGMRRRLAALAVTATAAVAALVLCAGSAFADTTLTLIYPASGSTFVSATNASLDLGPGSLTATADLTTGAVTGTLSLPDSTGSFTELGIVPVTATVAFIEDGPVTGTVNLQTGVTTATADVTLQITDLKVAGVDTFVGPDCETVTPAQITVTSQSGFTVLGGGPLSGTYTIPDFNNCGLLDSEAGLIDLTIPGPGNTIALTLGTPTVG
jgi:hypothetical protein